MTIFDEIYGEIVSRILASPAVSQEDRDRVAARNVIEYSDSDKTKYMTSSADYPKIEVIATSLTPDGSTSNAERYTAGFRVTVAVGEKEYSSRFWPIMLALIRVANGFKTLGVTSDDGHTYGASHSGITAGVYAPEAGKDTLKGFAFQFTLDVKVCLKAEVSR